MLCQVALTDEVSQKLFGQRYDLTVFQLLSRPGACEGPEKVKVTQPEILYIGEKVGVGVGNIPCFSHTAAVDKMAILRLVKGKKSRRGFDYEKVIKWGTNSLIPFL